MLILSPLFTIVFCFVSNYDGPRTKELAIYNNMFNETGVEKKSPLHIPESERNDYGNFSQRSTQARGVMGRKITPTLH